MCEGGGKGLTVMVPMVTSELAASSRSKRIPRPPLSCMSISPRLRPEVP